MDASRPLWKGGTMGDGVECVLAPNPGPMTLDGTNTWVLRVGSAPGQGCVVIDPGPDNQAHLRRVRDRAHDVGGGIAQILLTHAHADHSAGAGSLRELVVDQLHRPPVRALDPSLCLGDEGLGAGNVIDLGERTLRVLATPGHTRDSLSFVLSPDVGPLGGEAVDVLTGDTVLGRGTSVIAHPDGVLGPYLDSLRHLRSLVDHVGSARILPGHGPLLPDAVAILDYYLSHRHERLQQVRAAIVAGHRTADEIVAAVYADAPVGVRPAARLSVLAQLEYLSG